MTTRSTTKPRAYRHQYNRECNHCSKRFQTWCRAARYCSERCRSDAGTAKRRREPSCWLNLPVACGVCEAIFFRTIDTGPNKKYCSVECSIRARRRDHLRFKELHPTAMQSYNRQRVANHGPDRLMSRLRKRYPNLPAACETPGCGEDRVLDIAHKPAFRRYGAHRVLKHYERHMFWVLCPTCHAVIDRGAQAPEELGLK